MNIQADGNEKIAVTLSHQDMNELDITYDEMDYSNIETRRVIWTVLDEAKRVLGKPINTDGRLLVQVSPADDGGSSQFDEDRYRRDRCFRGLGGARLVHGCQDRCGNHQGLCAPQK